MNRKNIKQVFWKEYRQQRAMWIGVLALLFLMQLFLAMGEVLNDGNLSASFYLNVGLIMTALYGAASTGLLFASEHENGTYTLLRAIPVPCREVFWGKLAWSLAGTLSMAGIVWGASAIWKGHYPPGTASVDALLLTGVGIVEGLAWGLWWSLRMRKTIVTIVLGIASGSLVSYLIVNVLFTISGTRGARVEELYIDSGGARLVVALLVFAAAIYQGRNWFRMSEGGRERSPSPKKPMAGKVAMPLDPTRVPSSGMRRRFLWLYWRQSRRLLGILVSLLILFTLPYYWNLWGDPSRHDEEGIFIFPQFSALAALLFMAGTAFHADGQSAARIFLAGRGFSARRLWWTRFLSLFAMSQLLFFGFGASTYFVAQGGNSVFSYEVWGLAWMFWVQFLNMIAAGMLASLLVRSGILSLALTGILFLPLAVWSYVSGILFGFSLLWSWLPLVGGMLLMGYLHVDDWLAGRGGLRRWKRPLLALAVPLVFLAIAVPSARVYQIPKVDCGYVLDRRLVEEMLQYRANRMGHRLPDRSRFGLADWWSLMDQLDDAENGEMVRDMPKDQRLAHLLKMYRGAYLEMRDGFNRGELPLWRLYRPHLLLYRNVREWSDQCDKPEQVEEGIAFVREMPRWRISPTEVLQRQYQYDYLFARYGVYFPDVMNALTGDNENVVTMYILMNRLPWERERTLRQLDRVFQQKSQLAWQAELAFWDDVGDAREVYQQSWAMHDQYSYLRDGGRSEGDYYQIDPIYALSRQSGYSMCSQAYSMEADRRATLLYLALRGYFLQHGEVPESLDVLKGSRLEEIPKVPGIGLDYYYQPHPRKIDLEAFEEEEYRERKRLENLPPLVRDGLPYLWYPESGTIHYDIPFPSPHIEEAEQDWRRGDDGELIPLHFAKFTLNVDSAGEETSEVGDAATGEEAK